MQTIRFLSITLVIALLLSSAPAYAAPPAQNVPPSLQDCSAVAEETLQGELNRVTQQVFAGALAGVDLERIVDRQWVTLEMDATVDKAVDLAVARVQSETDLWNKFLSGWAPDKAKELTLSVANYTFDAPTFRARMDELSTAVAEDVAAQVAAASAESVSAALYCLQTFIGRNYAKALVNTFEERVQLATGGASLIDADAIGPDILQMVGVHQAALGGVGVIIAAQITRKIVASISQRISQRVAGRIAGRVLGRVGTTVIPIAGWVVGTGMIVYDLYASRDGALPQIQASIKSDAVKAGIRSEITTSIRPELEAEVPALARSIANDLYVEWRDLKRTVRQVLNLAAANPQFAAILGQLQTSEQVAQLVDLVGIVTAAGGQEALNVAIADGSLAAVANLPPSAVTLVEADGSLQYAIDWHNAVGSRLNDVVALEIYKSYTPETVDLKMLDQLLALGDKTAVARLGLLAPAQAATLLALPASTLVPLANQLTPDDLGWLADALPSLTDSQAGALVARILSQPSVVAPLRQLGDLQQLAAAGDLDAAITFVSGTRDPGSYLVDALGVVTFAASPQLFLAKYGFWPAAGAGMALLLIFLIAVRLVYGMGVWLVSPLAFMRRGKK